MAPAEPPTKSRGPLLAARTINADQTHAESLFYILLNHPEMPTPSPLERDLPVANRSRTISPIYFILAETSVCVYIANPNGAASSESDVNPNNKASVTRRRDVFIGNLPLCSAFYGFPTTITFSQRLRNPCKFTLEFLQNSNRNAKEESNRFKSVFRLSKRSN